MGLNQIVLLAEQVAKKSVSERLEAAFSNSAMSIIIVFGVLLLICIIISSFKIINKHENKRNGMTEPKKTAPHVDAIMEQIALKEEEELVDDLELVAVITAAIQAYEAACGNEIPANGLYVRSIKKVNTKWRNA